MDDQNTRGLDIRDFVKAIQDFKIQVEEREIRTVFDAFCNPSTNLINYLEFISGVRGEMNQFRKGLVELAFKKLDKNGEGILDANELKKTYSAKNHPEVKSGKKTQEFVCSDFIDTLDMQFKIGDRINEDKVTKSEFESLYENISISIEQDKTFELVIISAWKLYGEDAMSPPVERPISASQKAPFGTSTEPTVYTKQTIKTMEEDKGVAAGVPSWPKKELAKPSIVGYAEKQLLIKFKQCLLARGISGLLGLKRAFKVIFKCKKFRWQMKKAQRKFLMNNLREFSRSIV